jgi:preprotein translocase subunit SecG
VIRIILTIVFVILCIAMTGIVLMQEGKSAGLGAIGGIAESYWGKNRGRSMEGKLEKFTKIAAFGIFILAFILNLKFI